MTEASDAQAAIDRHARTSEPDLNRIQPGWQVKDRTGRLLGEVIERDDASVLVARGQPAEDSVRVPMRLVDREDPDGRTAVLTVLAGELRQLATDDGET